VAYNFLGLVNDVNRRLNEVELTSSNFDTAKGFYSHAKDAVNASIRHINQAQYQWPFNHVTQEEVLTAGTTRYSFPDDAKVIDFDSFRIKEDSTLGNNTVKLGLLDYDDYLQKCVDQEYTANENGRQLPQFVFHAPSLEYGMVPAPDQAYTVVYEYYRTPVDLENVTDVPVVPERFKHVIMEGAMYHAYLFRGNTQDASMTQQKFDASITQMRSMLINRTYYIRSYMLNRNQSVSGRLGTASTNVGSSLDSL
jgi:hypothetical protein|tara:strand:- start:747 stop:1502 length:756 start_codon:yes stop_codon:yes gene_type:complete